MFATCHLTEQPTRYDTIRVCLTCGRKLTRLSWLENAYSHPLFGVLVIFSSKAGRIDLFCVLLVVLFV